MHVSNRIIIVIVVVVIIIIIIITLFSQENVYRVGQKVSPYWSINKATFSLKLNVEQAIWGKCEQAPVGIKYSIHYIFYVWRKVSCSTIELDNMAQNSLALTAFQSKQKTTQRQQQQRRLTSMNIQDEHNHWTWKAFVATCTGFLKK